MSCGNDDLSFVVAGFHGRFAAARQRDRDFPVAENPM